MIETKAMAMAVRKLTAYLMLACAFLSLFLFPGEFKTITMGIVIGSFCGLMGFNMIVNMAGNIDGDTQDVKARAMRSYSRRYLLYALVFACSVALGVHILALLVGMLAHKGSILLYTFQHRKEDE